jgi:hypothetical protein
MTIMRFAQYRSIKTAVPFNGKSVHTRDRNSMRQALCMSSDRYKNRFLCHISNKEVDDNGVEREKSFDSGRRYL